MHPTKVKASTAKETCPGSLSHSEQNSHCVSICFLSRLPRELDPWKITLPPLRPSSVWATENNKSILRSNIVVGRPTVAREVQIVVIQYYGEILRCEHDTGRTDGHTSILLWWFRAKQGYTCTNWTFSWWWYGGDKKGRWAANHTN